jgi:hypothetical protein
VKLLHPLLQPMIINLWSQPQPCNQQKRATMGIKYTIQVMTFPPPCIHESYVSITNSQFKYEINKTKPLFSLGNCAKWKFRSNQKQVRIFTRGVTLQARLLCYCGPPFVNTFSPVKTQSLHELSPVSRKEVYV